MTLARNPTYWKAGRPYLDEIVIKFLPNAASRVMALQAGEIDYINEYSLPQSFFSTVAANKELQTAESGYYADYVIILNTRQAPLDQATVRQALMMAIDRDYLTKAVFSGLGTAAVGPFDARIGWAYNPDVDYRKMYPYDPAKARALLDAAGVKPGSDGTRFAFDLVFDSTRQEYGPLSVALQKFWGEVGVRLNLRGSERTVVLKQVYADYDFGATLQNYGTSGDPALGIARLYVTGSIKQGATFNNVSRYSNPEVDKLFADGQNNTTQEERAAALSPGTGDPRQGSAHADDQPDGRIQCGEPTRASSVSVTGRAVLGRGLDRTLVLGRKGPLHREDRTHQAYHRPIRRLQQGSGSYAGGCQTGWLHLSG